MYHYISIYRWHTLVTHTTIQKYFKEVNSMRTEARALTNGNLR